MPDTNPLTEDDGFFDLWAQACLSAAHKLEGPIRECVPLSWRSVELAIASCYAASYADMPSVMDAYRDELDAFMAKLPDSTELNRDCAREVLACAVVSGATAHACADIDLTADDFTQRACEALDVQDDFKKAYDKIKSPVAVAHAARQAASRAGASQAGQTERSVSHGIL